MLTLKQASALRQIFFCSFSVRFHQKLTVFSSFFVIQKQYDSSCHPTESEIGHRHYREPGHSENQPRHSQGDGDKKII